jgi:hypothetical protein
MPEEKTPQEKPEEKKADDYTPPATQADLDRIIADRLKREKAKYADYDDLKARAAKFDEAEQKVKTAEQKANERMEALERKLADAELGALKSRIQAKFSISDDDAELFLTASDEDGLTAQAEALAAKAGDKLKSGLRDPKEGRTPKKPADDDSETRGFIADLTESA